MLAFACSWRSDTDQQFALNPQDLAKSLCDGIGGRVYAVQIGFLNFAFRPLRPLSNEEWQPARLDDGRLVAFHGYLDNRAELAAALGASENDEVAALYGLALAAWGEDADCRIVGEYCTIVADPLSRSVRLARSPLRAPPLVYHHERDMSVVASVPRAIFAAGVEQSLDEAHVADSAMMNFFDTEASWFEGLRRVPLASVVELSPGEPRRLRQYYDSAKVPRVRMPSTEAYIKRANELFDEAVRVTLSGFKRPGVTLSGGLDSPQVAVRALSALPDGQRLPTFTFHTEAGWDGITDPGTIGDERELVEQFAAMHPRIDPHFTANEGYGHDHRWNDLFGLMGGAPNGLGNLYVYHGLWSMARQQGCDVLLFSEWGNATFSENGVWGFVEYLFKGRWRQLWLALKHQLNDDRPLPIRFIARCLLPLLPNRLWKLALRLYRRGERPLYELWVPLNADYRERIGANRRLQDTDFIYERYQPRSRAHACKLKILNSEYEASEIFQAFEQLYGLPCRDPTTYRPFVEFCFGLPTDLFLRDGKARWLAKELARGIMPEKQRENRLNGRWDADWHLRIKRRRDDYLEELDRIEADEELNAMLDVPRLRSALLDFPESTITDKQRYSPIEYALTRGLLTARFVNFVKGRN